MEPRDYMYKELYAHAKCNTFFEKNICRVQLCFGHISIFLYPSLSPSLCFGLCLVHYLFKDSIQAIIDSNLQRLFYNMASIIDYSKKPLDTSVVNNPPPKQIFSLLLSPSPLKGSPMRTIVARTSPLGLAAIWRLTGSFGQMFAQHQMRPSPFVPTADCPPVLILPRPSHVSRYAIAYAELHFPSFTPSFLRFFESSFSSYPPLPPLFSWFVGCVQFDTNPF